MIGEAVIAVFFTYGALCALEQLYNRWCGYECVWRRRA